MANDPSPIRALREAAGMTQEALARALQITRQRVAQIERADPVPASLGLRLLALLPSEASALGITLDSMLRHRRTTRSGRVRRSGRGPAKPRAESEAPGTTAS